MKLTDYLACGILLFLLAIQLVATAAALHFPVDIGFVVNLAVAMLFIFLGNYLAYPASGLNRWANRCRSGSAINVQYSCWTIQKGGFIKNLLE